MDKKGQITVGVIIGAFIAVIVGLIILQGTFPYIGATTNSFDLVNRTVTGSNTQTDVVGQELLGTPIVTNRTGQQVVGAGNYTIEETISLVDGLKRISYRTLPQGNWNTTAVNISYAYGQEGYIDNAGGRGVTNLIPIMAALALIVVLVALVMKEKLFQ